jgi:hypothetical protein
VTRHPHVVCQHNKAFSLFICYIITLLKRLLFLLAWRCPRPACTTCSHTGDLQPSRCLPAQQSILTVYLLHYYIIITVVISFSVALKMDFRDLKKQFWPFQEAFYIMKEKC